MKSCIYCQQDKEEREFTLEHVIPQFLGGGYAPDYFKIRDVCKNCNSNLGLFVDAGFEKSWIVSNNLRHSVYAFFDPNSPSSLPLICMGKLHLAPPNQQENEVCEYWIGPLGEQIFWIRPSDERLYWYSGGNPRTVKKVESRAYFFLSERSIKKPLISWLAFRDAFEGRRVKKIMGNIVIGANPADIGFSTPDEIDSLRVEHFKYNCFSNKEQQLSFSFYELFDLRFLSKLAIGIAYSLFGRKALKTRYAEELYKGLWYRDGDLPPDIYGTLAITQGSDPYLSKLTGEQHAVTITIATMPDGIVLTLNLGASLSWVVKCASLEGLTDEDVRSLQNGRVIVLFRPLQLGFDITHLNYIAHKLGKNPHPGLTEIANRASMHRGYFKNLSALNLNPA